VRPTRVALLVALVPAVVAGACSYFDEPEPYRPPAYYAAEDAEARALGQRLYQRDCSFCHGSQAEGTDRGPDLISGANGPALVDFMLRTGRMPIDDPDEPVRHGPSRYTEEEIAAIVAYLDDAVGQPGPHIPELDLEGADLGEGRALYQEHCSACHATTGIGGAMIAHRDGDQTGIAIPSLAESTPVEIAEAVRTGPGAMPPFGPGLVDDDQLNSLVRYVTYLQDPDDRGGFPIGRVGPVVEGAIGWVLGLGVLILFIRWVGTKRGERA
jgi:ubiquinol-cytochrome c reductase cytochrome c subunit